MYKQLQDLIDREDNFIGTQRSDDDFNNGIDREFVKLPVKSCMMEKYS